MTNTKQNSMSATQQNEQSIYQIQTAAELSESGKLWVNSSVFSWRLKDASDDNDVRDAVINSNNHVHTIVTTTIAGAATATATTFNDNNNNNNKIAFNIDRPPAKRILHGVIHIIIIIIIHEFHGDTSLKQNCRAAVNVTY